MHSLLRGYPSEPTGSTFGPQLRSDFPFQTTGTGLAPLPARLNFGLKRTLSVNAFSL